MANYKEIQKDNFKSKSAIRSPEIKMSQGKNLAQNKH